MTKSGKEEESTIFHIATEPNFRSCLSDDFYEADSLKTEGFIHCTSGESVLLAVAENYFSEATDPLLVLKIDLPKVKHEVRFEPPATVEGVGKSHVELASLFPHIYGPLNISAISGIGFISRSDGKFVCPKDFVDPKTFGI